MRIPTRPKEVSTTLADFRDQEDAPEFFYRFPSAEDEADLLMDSVSSLVADPRIQEELANLDKEARAERVNELLASGEISVSNRYGRYLCEVFDRFITRIEQLEVGDPPEAFDLERHLGDIPGPWKMEVGREIITRAKSHLTEIEEGNSSSPSSSAGTMSVTASAAADAAS